MKTYLLSILILLPFAGQSKQIKEYTLEIPNSTRSLVMKSIVGGQYMMGSPDAERGRKGDEGPQHMVKVDDFWMGSHEITWEQYEAFVYRQKETEKMLTANELKKLGIDGITSATTPYVEMSFGMGKEGYPAVNITHYAAVMFCKWLTAQTGDFYRLPTEAEWEYVCKTGKSTVYTFGDSPDQLDQYAVLDQEKYDKAGTLKPNSWGIYDIHGNAAEWTMDQYGPYSKTKSIQSNPWVRPEKLYPRVARGGSWQSDAGQSRCSSRLASMASWKQRDPQLPKSRWWLTNAPFMGFRIVRPVKPPSTKEIQRYWLDAIDDYGQ